MPKGEEQNHDHDGRLPAGLTVLDSKTRKRARRDSSRKRYSTRRLTPKPQRPWVRKIRRGLIVEAENWDWALKQPGGASAWINHVLRFARAQDERRQAKKEITKLRA